MSGKTFASKMTSASPSVAFNEGRSTSGKRFPDFWELDYVRTPPLSQAAKAPLNTSGSHAAISG